jgi:hypothetical protein
LLEFCSRDATTVRITYTYGGGNRELVVTCAYLPYDSDEPPPSKEVKDIIDYCYSRKSNSSLGVTPMHTTYYGGAPASIREEKALWSIW